MTDRLGTFLRSSIGKKTLMSVTGLCLVVFLIAHLAGNLVIYFGGPEAFDAYSAALHAKPALLYAGEIGLAAIFIVHIYLAIRVSLENREARPVRYRLRNTHGAKTPAAASMLITGVIILIFLVIHLLDFRLAGLDDHGLAAAVVRRLSSVGGALIYLVGVAAVLLHLSHAIRSALQSLGFNHPLYNAWLARAGVTLALLLGLGFATFPILLFASPGSFAPEPEESALVAPGDSGAPSPTESATPERSR